MKTTRAPSGQIYAHNSSFTGTVKFELPVHPDKDWDGDGNRSGVSKPFRQAITQREVVEVEITFEDMKHLVLSYLRSQAVGFLEQTDDAALEKFFIRNMS